MLTDYISNDSNLEIEDQETYENITAEAPNSSESDESGDSTKSKNKESMSSKCAVEGLKKVRVCYEGQNFDCKYHLYVTEK